MFTGLFLVYLAELFVALQVGAAAVRAIGFFHTVTGVWLMYLTVAVVLNTAIGYSLPAWPQPNPARVGLPQHELSDGSRTPRPNSGHTRSPTPVPTSAAPAHTPALQAERGGRAILPLTARGST